MRCARDVVHLATVIHLVLAGAVSGQVPPRGNALQVSLVRLATYGSEEPRLEDMRSEIDKKVGGAVFGRIPEFAIGPDHRLYVLDAEFLKVAVFDSAGRYVRSFVGGYGKGPGEFVRPRSLTIMNDGMVAVLDQGAARLSFFSPSGQFDRSLTIPYSQPLQIAAAGEALLLRRWALTGRRALVTIRPDGMPLDSAFAIGGRDADFAEFGESGYLSTNKAGAAVYVRPTPGQWAVWTNRQWRSNGVDLYPSVRGRADKISGATVHSVPVSVKGYAELGDGTQLLLVRYTAAGIQPGGPITRGSYLVLYDAHSRYLGYAKLPDGHDGPMSRGFSGDDILIGVIDPFPRVIRYRVARGNTR